MAAMFRDDALWNPAWVEAGGEATIRTRTAAPKGVKFFCGWFCPFAQRAWIALEEKGVDYQYIDVNPYEVDESNPGGYTKRALPLDIKRERYSEFVACSPRGMVPGLNAEGERVWDSMAVVEYVNDRFDGPSLLPGSALKRAHVRIYINHFNDRVWAPYMKMLMAQDPTVQEMARKGLFEGCHELANAMSTEGPFFLGGRFSLFEVVTAGCAKATPNEIPWKSHAAQSSLAPSVPTGSGSVSCGLAPLIAGSHSRRTIPTSFGCARGGRPSRSTRRSPRLRFAPSGSSRRTATTRRTKALQKPPRRCKHRWERNRSERPRPPCDGDGRRVSTLRVVEDNYVACKSRCRGADQSGHRGGGRARIRIDRNSC